LILLMLGAGVVACAVTSATESTGGYGDDSAVTAEVKALLAKDDFRKSFQISVATYRGATCN
jgi:osmotically-inducible protein OsmY